VEDYEAKYYELKKFLINLRPYCDTCKHSDNESVCDECNRKAFNWSFDEKVLNKDG